MAEKGAVYCDRTTRTNYYTALVSEEEYKLAEGTTYPAGKDVPQVIDSQEIISRYYTKIADYHHYIQRKKSR